MTHPTLPPGPDFAAGIPSTWLADGKMLLGHANGESILLSRVDGQVYATEATCTHYGGSLVDGILVGEHVYCPLHHSCFSVRTGEALTAPALTQIGCYRVMESDGTIVVLDRIHPVADTLSFTSPPSSVVIIGGGAAGIAAAEMLRRQGYTGSLRVFDAHNTFPVDRPNLSKDNLSGSAPEDWIFLKPPTFYEDLEIDLTLGTPIAKIDLAKRVVVTDHGAEHPYDKLLLAMGADPVRLSIPGNDLPHVHYLRTLDDNRAIIKDAGDAKQAVVIGGSFIGLEVAASLRARGINVSVIAPETRPLERVLGPDLGDMIRAEHESHGVEFHLGRQAKAIEANAVVLDDGTRLPADFVVVGVGVRPTISLAEQAGLSMDNGIVVDDYLQTSDPHVYAAGDIARWPAKRFNGPIRVEHWVVAQRQGQVAAKNILGAREQFTATPFFWSQHYDTTVNYVGHATKWSRIGIDGNVSAKDCTVTYYDGDKVLAVATVNRDLASLEADEVLEAGV